MSTKSTAQMVRNAEASRQARPSRSWLLGNTALFAGVMAAGLVGAPIQARASDVCSAGDYYVCGGSGNTQIVLTSEGNFSADIGSQTPFQLDYFTIGSPAFLINADGNNSPGADGSDSPVHLFTNSFIRNNEDGVGLRIRDPGSVGVNVVIDGAGDGEGDKAAFIKGSIGIQVLESGFVSGTSHVHIQNNGHVEGTGGAGIEANGTNTEDGTLSVQIDNNSYGSTIGTTDASTSTTISPGQRSATAVA
jgi:hypothetical protein